MTDILDWTINLPTIFLPIAQALVDFFNTPVIELIRNLAGPEFPDWISIVIEFVLEQFGLNLTVFDMLLGAGIILVLTLTLIKWIIGIIQ